MKKKLCMNDKISIIIPCFNSSRYLEQTLKSIISQSYKIWEVILIDDNSKDNTFAICKKYRSISKKFKIYKNKKNLGPGATRRVALKYITGEYVCFLDSDDYWLKNKLFTQLHFMKKNNLTLSCTNSLHKKKSILKREFGTPNILNYKTLLRHNYIITSTVMIKSNVIKSSYIKNVGYDDYNLWLNLTKKGNEFHYIDKHLVIYRHVRNSISQNKFRAFFWVLRIYLKSQKLNFIESIYFLAINSFYSIFKKTRYEEIK